MEKVPAHRNDPRGVAPHHASSLGTGALALIPVPFLDEWMIGKHRRRLVESILAKRGISFDGKGVEALVNGGRGRLSRASSRASGLLIKPLKKLFRSVLIWLTVRNAARAVLETHLLVRFLQHPSFEKSLEGGMLDRRQGRRLGKVFRSTTRGLDLKAAASALARLKSLLRRSRRTTPGEIVEVIETGAPGFLRSFDESIGRELEGRPGR